MNYIKSEKSSSDRLIQELFQESQQLISDGDGNGACQILFLCAGLHKRLGNYEASLDCIQRAWELADSHNMPEVVEWAAWGSCALHILLGEPDQAINSLTRLRSQLSNKGDWVLANLVELFATELTDRAKGNKTIEIPLDWLLQWGEMPVSTNGTSPDHILSKNRALQSLRKTFSSLVGVPWCAILVKLKNVASGPVRPTGNNNGFQAEDSPNSFIDISIPTSPIHQTGEQSPHPDEVSLPPDRETSTLTQPSSTSSSLSIPVGHSTEVMPARVGDGRTLLTVYCLGQFRVSLNDQWISSWPSGKGKSILKFMVVNYPRPISKEVLMDTFWREADPVAARNSLYVAISGLRQAFKAVLPEFNPILFEEDHYCLNPEMSMWLDVEEFLQLYNTGQEFEQSGRLVETIQAYESAANLYQGDFLADDLYEEWPVPPRERLRITYLDTLDRLSRIYFNQGQYLACINLCFQILERDNCREDAHRRLMRCYSRQGQHRLALGQYQACVEALRSELDVDPEPVTVQLAERIRRRESV